MTHKYYYTHLVRYFISHIRKDRRFFQIFFYIYIHFYIYIYTF